MNFLLRNSQSNAYELPAVADSIEKDHKVLESSSSWPGALPGLGGADSSAGEDARLLANSAKMRTRMPIEDHADVLPEEGSILIPISELQLPFPHFVLFFLN